MLISCIINCDTRIGFQEDRSQVKECFSGCISEDFLTDGVFNKIKFLEGFEKEIIVYIDQHTPVPEKTLDYLHSMADMVCIRKHTTEPKFNDNNYVRALQMGGGDIIMHFDQDCAAFSPSTDYLNELINHLENYSFVSYPSSWSPNPVDDPRFDYRWCSTRFFMCKRETLDFTEIKKCLASNEYLYDKYPASVHDSWLEHILGLYAKYNGNGVFYPKIELSKGAIFTWGNYEKYVLRRLNELPYEDVVKFINNHGGIQYPNDINIW